MKRDDLLKSLLPQYFKPGCTWLDVGAGDGSVSLQLNKLLKPSNFHCLDVAPPVRRKPFHPTVHKFDGTGEGITFFNGRQGYQRGQGPCYDFVLFNFVLHHAAHNMWNLLQSAASLTNCIVIQEDLLEEWPAPHRPTKSVRQLLTEHDPKAIYHSFDEWQKLLRQNLNQHRHAIDCIRHPDVPVDDTFGYHVPRGIFIVNFNHAKAQ